MKKGSVGEAGGIAAWNQLTRRGRRGVKGELSLLSKLCKLSCSKQGFFQNPWVLFSSVLGTKRREKESLGVSWLPRWDPIDYLLRRVLTMLRTFVLA